MITNKEAAIKTISSHQGEFAEVKNPSYIYPPVEYYPLAAPLKSVKHLKAALMDMDGTTTTTEVLCIYALEQMVRRMSSLLSKDSWVGVDHEKDLAHIIGNSTTRHVEYLIHKYGNLLSHKHTVKEFLNASQWTLANSPDQQRKAEVVQNLKKLGLQDAVLQMQQSTTTEEKINVWAGQIKELDFTTQVNLGIDIYYETYHRILMMLKQGKGSEVRMQVFGSIDSEENLISPMPGIPVLIPLLKGWLGEEAPKMAGELCDNYEKLMGKQLSSSQKEEVSRQLGQMGLKFRHQPLKLALVTSSIFYEADIIIQEVQEVMKTVIEKSSLSADRKKSILAAYEDYHNVYDAFVTASDSSEIRLKPHRDLYSIALHKCGIMPADFDKVIGFEDSQSGTLAIRAAGIGCCIAVPFAQTLQHNLEAATHVLPGGVPEAIIDLGLFMDQDNQ